MPADTHSTPRGRQFCAPRAAGVELSELPVAPVAAGGGEEKRFGRPKVQDRSQNAAEMARTVQERQLA